jgi:TPR repeat protein
MIDKDGGEQPWIQMAGFRLGNFYEQQGDTEAALRWYTRVAEMKDGTQALVQSAQERIHGLTRGAGQGGTQAGRDPTTGGSEPNAPLP